MPPKSQIRTVVSSSDKRPRKALEGRSGMRPGSPLPAAELLPPQVPPLDGTADRCLPIDLQPMHALRAPLRRGSLLELLHLTLPLLLLRLLLRRWRMRLLYR